MGNIGKVDPGAVIAALRPFVVLQEDKGFQAWLKTVEGELDQLKDFSWQLGGIDRFAKFDAALNEMGMVRPTSQEEMRQLWMCARAVINYWMNKMAFLKDMKVRHDFLIDQQKLLNEIEAKDEELNKKKVIHKRGGRK